MPNPKLQSLLVFDAIIRSGSLAGAAEELSKSESSISYQLSELESIIDLQLFDRSGRGLVLSTSGRHFHEEIKPIIERIRELPRTAAAIRDQNHEILSIVCTPRLSLGLLPRVIKRLSLKYPNMRLKCSILRNYDINRWVVSWPFHIGMTMIPVENARTVVSHVAEARVCALVSTASPIARLNQISIEELRRQKIIKFDASTKMARVIDDILGVPRDAPESELAGKRNQKEANTNRREGVSKPIGKSERDDQKNPITQLSPSSGDIEVSAATLALRLAAEGNGISIIDAVSALDYFNRSDVRLVPITPACWWQVAVFRRPENVDGHHDVLFKRAMQCISDEFDEIFQTTDLIRQHAADIKRKQPQAPVQVNKKV